MVLKLILAVTILLSAIPIQAQKKNALDSYERFQVVKEEREKGWGFICASDTGSFFYKIHSLRIITPSIKESWVKERIIDTEGMGNKDAATIMELYQFDCTNRTSRVLNRATYSSEGNFLDSVEYTKPTWTHYIPDSVGEGIWSHFCSEPSPRTKRKP